MTYILFRGEATQETASQFLNFCGLGTIRGRGILGEHPSQANCYLEAGIVLCDTWKFLVMCCFFYVCCVLCAKCFVVC